MRTSFAPRGGVEYREQDGKTVQVYPPIDPPTSTQVTTDTDPDDGPEWSVRVAIGRNVGDNPLPRDLWNNYKSAVRDALLLHVVAGNPHIETHDGYGTYNRIPEESAVLSLIGATSFDYDNFLFVVRRIAKTYGQKAVAVTFGWTTLVTTD